MKHSQNFFKMKKIRTLILFLLSINMGLLLGQSTFKVENYYPKSADKAIDGQLLTYDTMGGDSKTVKNGIWYYYFPNGEVWCKGEYVDDKEQGLWEVYYPNGNLVMEIVFDSGEIMELGGYKFFSSLAYDDKRVKRAQVYWDDGKPAYEYEDGYEQILSTRYKEKYTYRSGAYGSGKTAISAPAIFNGNITEKPSFTTMIMLIDTYIEAINSNELSSTELNQYLAMLVDVNSIKDLYGLSGFMRVGEWHEYKNTGELSAVGKYNGYSNKMDGPWVLYHKNGTKSGDRVYKKGKLDGPLTKYHEDGSLKWQGKYVGGLVSGTFKSWNDQGGLEQVSVGTALGTIKRKYVYQNGSTKAIGTEFYSKKKKEYLRKGDWEFFREDGSPSLTEIYKEGKIIGHRNQYLPDGTQILVDGTGFFRTFYDSGEISFEAEYRDGARDGIANWYYKNGQLKQSIKYEYDESLRPQGKRLTIVASYDKNGTPRDGGTLKDGNGNIISYDDKGIATSTMYRNGRAIK